MKFLKHFTTFTKFKEFDQVTHFRLKNSIIVAFTMGLLSPVIITLKGTFMLVWVIAMFGILGNLAVKTNDYLSTLGLDKIYKLGVIFHLVIILVTTVYFFNPLYMIYLDSFFLIVDIAIFSTYSILLNNYIADFYPTKMKEFQIIRNSSWADGYLLGLGVSALVTYFFSLSGAIYLFVLCELLFTLWLFKNWRFYEADHRN